MFTLRSPAKINWSLYVLDKRGDGYHNILSLMQCVGLYDELSFEHADEVELVSDTDIPSGLNIVLKAAEKLKKHSGIKKGAKITLKKEIPAGSGLGGGSSNAAYTLTGLNRLWGLGLGRDELSEIGAGLGSDVPFFFNCPMAIAGGRGEVLTPLTTEISYSLLIVKPGVSVPTKWAYEEITPEAELTKNSVKIHNIQFLSDALRAGDIYKLRSFVHNDFENVVTKRHSIIGSLKRELLEEGAVLASMSGSGSAVFGLFEDMEKAYAASGRFSAYFNKVAETLKNGSG